MSHLHHKRLAFDNTLVSLSAHEQPRQKVTSMRWRRNIRKRHPTGLVLSMTVAKDAKQNC